MKTYTFDTNCLIDLDVERPSAPYIRQLIASHRRQKIEVAFVAVSASERQKGDKYLDTYRDFLNRLEKLKISDIPQLEGLAYWDLSYWDHALWASPEDDELEQKIHQTLFPRIPFLFSDAVSSQTVTSETASSKLYSKWRNAWCDRQMIWAHIHHERDFFVTRDGNFAKKLRKCQRFQELKIVTPEIAVSQLDSP